MSFRPTSPAMSLRTSLLLLRAALAALAALAAACSSGSSGDGPLTEGPCAITGETPDFLQRLDCAADFQALASEPLDTSIPGARATKVVIDREDDDAVYFQNSRKYRIHYEFASRHLSGNGRGIVPSLAAFNMSEYYAPTRRFLLGSITYYEGPKLWAFEIAPYDNADATMVAAAYDAVRRVAFFGKALHFHPTSTSVERLVAKLPSHVKVKTTEQLFAAIDYQPLNLATGIGRLRRLTVAELATEYVGFRDIVVLDHAPNDLSVTSGIITEEFQTPLSHINVLAQNRRIPNMALRNARMDPRIVAFEGKWVRLTVTTSSFEIAEVTAEEAEAFWQAHKPTAVSVPRRDESVKELRDVEAILDPALPLGEAIKAAIPAFGGKATHYGAMARAKIVPMPKAFAVPVHFYVQHLERHGFAARITELLADPTFRADPKVRDQKLALLRDDIVAAPLDAAFEAQLLAKLTAEYPGLPMRFRSSTTAEDLDGFTGAGLYTSKTGEPNNPEKSYAEALKKVWASAYRFRAFEERDYRSIEHTTVGMAVLVHNSFPAEEVTGVALTANPFDPAGLQPGFFINAQVGEFSVTLPEAGVKADQFLYQHDQPGQPVTYIERSSLVEPGKFVLTPLQIRTLGDALAEIHRFFRPVYGPPPTNPNGWYGLEVDFKFDGAPGEEPKLWIKQARPHPGRGSNAR
jgi:pyruvate, water dikinase